MIGSDDTIPDVIYPGLGVSDQYNSRLFVGIICITSGFFRDKFRLLLSKEQLIPLSAMTNLCILVTGYSGSL